jgi:hypothetical protein
MAYSEDTYSNTGDNHDSSLPGIHASYDKAHPRDAPPPPRLQSRERHIRVPTITTFSYQTAFFHYIQLINKQNVCHGKAMIANKHLLY